MNKIEEALIKRFEEQRVIFWYDEKQEMEEQFQAIDLDNVQKIHVKGNEFEVKYIVKRVLLYNKPPIKSNIINYKTTVYEINKISIFD